MRIQLQYVDPRKLLAYEANNRTHPESQILEIMASIEAFGFNKPVAVNNDMVLIYGHGATEAAVRLGLAEIPYINLGHLSEREQRAYRIADNKIAQNSGWDFGALSDEVDALIEMEFDIDVLGFDEQELEAILKQDTGILPSNWGERKSESSDVQMEQTLQVSKKKKTADGLGLIKARDIVTIGEWKVVCTRSKSMTVSTQYARALVELILEANPGQEATVNGEPYE